ncbi:hypothetical protein WJX74_004172 [Apatococcus lobatus]|uniref:IQCH-like ATP-grasp domain-containing protein n=1 Tax=Apatococcus lobatus TaxID=904363 RepID=A0AAW1S3D7_9CHLO
MAASSPQSSTPAAAEVGRLELGLLQALSALECCKLHLHHGKEESGAWNEIEAAETNLRREIKELSKLQGRSPATSTGSKTIVAFGRPRLPWRRTGGPVVPARRQNAGETHRDAAWHPPEDAQQLQAILSDHFQRTASATVPTQLANIPQRAHCSADLRADVIKEEDIQLPPEDEVESLPDFSMALTTCGSLTSGSGSEPHVHVHGAVLPTLPKPLPAFQLDLSRVKRTEPAEPLGIFTSSTSRRVLPSAAQAVSSSVTSITIHNGMLATLVLEAAAGYHPRLPDLLATITNLQDCTIQLRRPGQRFRGPDGYYHAATCIQARMRGILARQAVKKDLRQRAAAQRIQAAWRRRHLFITRKIQIMTAMQARLQQYEALQLQLARTWESLQREPHVIVFLLPASSTAPAAILPRLCSLANPLIHVIAITSPTPAQELQNMWRAFLTAGGIKDIKHRLHLICPENASRLPASMGLTAHLLSSPKTIKRIQLLRHGMPGYVIPAHMDTAEVELAAALGLPCFSGPPAVHSALCNRFFARSIFTTAGVASPPGVQIAGDQATSIPQQDLPPVSSRISTARSGRLAAITTTCSAVLPPGPAQQRGTTARCEAIIAEAVAEAMLMCPHLPEWILKINSIPSSRGHAVLRTSRLPEADQAMLRQAAETMPGVETSTGTSSISVACLTASLQLNLAAAIEIGDRAHFRTWRRFARSLCSKGGLVEAHFGDNIGSPMVNLRIEPTGVVSVLSTHEQIFCPARYRIGTSMPSTSVSSNVLFDTAQAIGETCWAAGLIGDVAVDFLVVPQKDGSSPLVAVDLKPFAQGPYLSFLLFDFLQSGHWDPRQGIYTLDPEQLAADIMRAYAIQHLSVHPEAENSYSNLLSTESVDILQTVRCFVAIDSFTQTSLNHTSAGDFLRRCRLSDIYFDMADGTGASLQIMHPMIGRGMGISCSSTHVQDCFMSLLKVLHQIDVARQEAQLEACALDEDIGKTGGFHSIYTTFKHLCEQLRKASFS